MYDRPEIQPVNDGLWAAIAVRLMQAGLDDVPDHLDRARPLAALWDDSGLLLAQCCGYPFVTKWRGRLQYVATPRYRAGGCEGSEYRSRIVVRADDPAQKLSDLRDRRAAINELDSNSGMNLFRAALAPIAAGHAFFSTVIETGSHVESARRIAGGGADVAAIDTVSFAHLERHERDTASRLRTIGWTDPAPGLPLVTSVTTSASELEALRRALGSVSADPALADVREALLLDGFDILNPKRYDSLLEAERRAERLGYPILA
jgi:ABC-type phosphate/phosphonate transport system substrate-binding protein